MSNLSTYHTTENLEIIVNEQTGEAFASVRGYARMAGVAPSTVNRRLQKLESVASSKLKTAETKTGEGFESVASSKLKTAEIQTNKGLRTVHLIPASLCFKWAMNDNPELAEAMGTAGATIYLQRLAGYEVKLAPANTKPTDYLSALKELVKAEEERLQLAKANEHLATICDELYSYSSIIRVAKESRTHESNFNWRVLKKASERLGCEIKKATCQRYGTKNLYSHDAWAYAYPQAKLPQEPDLRD